MNIKKKLWVSLLTLIISFACALPACAWFYMNCDFNADSPNPNTLSGSSLAAYFAGGDGTEGSPYMITSPVHLYNLAWLQNLGEFETKTYFELGDDIDMAGFLTGDDRTTGAIPPIGSKAAPFIGEFNGNGKVIKNLWVSTVKTDWKEQPSNPAEYTSQYAGMFGAIGDTAVVKDFILDRIEVTTHIEDSVVGLICGYVDAKLNGVRVFNGILTAKQGLTKVSTRYSLIGDISENVSWEDMPAIDTSIGQGTVGGETGGSGGGLVVNPSEVTDSSVASGNCLEVLDSIPGTAYYTGEVSFTSFNPKGSLYDINSGKSQITTSYMNGITNAERKERLQSAYDVYHASDTILTMETASFASDAEAGAEPSSYVSASVLQSDGTLKNQNIPANGLWFNPVAAGTAALSFGVTNMSDSRHMMVYKLERVSDTVVRLVSKTEYLFEKHKPVGNSDGVYYELEITRDDIINGYEFFIGWSCDNPLGDSTSCGFLYFELAGTNVNLGTGGTGGTGDGTKHIIDVDYITENEVTNLTRTTIHQSLLRFYYNSTALASDTSIYYTAIPDTTAATGSNVHYYWTPTSVTIPMVEFATGKESEKGTAGDFYARSDTSEEAETYVPLSGSTG